MSTQEGKTSKRSSQTTEVIEGVKVKITSRYEEKVERAVGVIAKHLNVVWTSEMVYNVEGSFHQYLLTGDDVIKESA